MKAKATNLRSPEAPPVEDHLHAEVSWARTSDPERPYEAKVGFGTWTVRVNDFPDERLFTLLIDGREEESFDEWPALWSGPASRRR